MKLLQSMLSLLKSSSLLSSVYKSEVVLSVSSPFYVIFLMIVSTKSPIGSFSRSGDRPELSCSVPLLACSSITVYGYHITASETSLLNARSYCVILFSSSVRHIMVLGPHSQALHSLH